ncbi:MAG TPA: MFS transporter [Ignavibacteria bacterium]|nr:MFS transporter [Bacteroidota bacterium]HRI86003.1 MFS transporter [Ignavibacteria bacterium]HRK00497.1 MFS transporter [Ignavibacteria bacterium]
MKNKSQVLVWSLFDFGNSSYAVIIVAFVFAVFFKEVIASGESIGDFYWSLGINISMLISAVLNPVFGAIADYSSNKKKFLFLFTLLCVVSTSLMYFTGEGTIVFALVLFILSNIGFQTGLTFYDAFISEISEPKDYNKVSGYGYAAGYVGSVISVALVFPLKDNPNLLFAISAFFFLIFSLPLFLFLKEKKRPAENVKINYIAYGFKKVLTTLKNINSYRNLKNFLFSFFFYIDAVNTIIFFSGIYASSTLNFTITELAVFFLTVQITAMIGSFVFVKIGDRIGIIKSIYINLIFWTLITLAVFITNDKNSFFIIGGFAGFFLGSTQSLSRALMTFLTPQEIKTEFFGFYALMDKTSTLIGPLTFGLVSWLSGSQKLAILSVGFFFLVGMLLLHKVKVKEILK